MTGPLLHPMEGRFSARKQSLPRLDVIVPCYNYGRFLRACLGSVLDQTGCQVRALIIDDCSADDSLDIARAIAAEDSRVQVLAHAVNRGHISRYVAKPRGPSTWRNSPLLTSQAKA